MTIRVSSSRRRRQSPSHSRTKYRLQKPNGIIGPRVKEVGGEHFAIVCVDPAKHRSEWMMADYFGNVLIEPRTLEHQGAFFKAAVALIREAQHRMEFRPCSTRVGLFDRMHETTPEIVPGAASCQFAVASHTLT